MDIKDIAIRLLKTFIQGFLGALAVTLPSSDFSDIAVVKSLLIGALAGGLSAIMNLILQYMNTHKKQQTVNEDSVEELFEEGVISYGDENE